MTSNPAWVLIAIGEEKTKDSLAGFEGTKARSDSSQRLSELKDKWNERDTLAEEM